MTTKIAYFGDAFCRPSATLPVKTFVDLVNMHYGNDVDTVCLGRPGGTDLDRILEDIDRTQQQTGMDVAMVFHEIDRNRDRGFFQDRQRQIDDWFLSRPQISVLHLIDPDGDNIELTSGQVDREIMNYIKWTRRYRVAAGYERSDNGIDQVGNWRAATRLIEFIDQHRQA